MIGIRAKLGFGAKLAVACACLALVGGSIFTAHGADEKATSSAAMRAEILNMIRAGTVDEAKYTDFFNNYYFPQLVDAKKLEDWPKLRGEMKNSFIRAAKEGPAHDYLNKLVLDKMRELATAKAGKLGENEAVIKYNAMLMLGDLNQDEAVASAPPKPLSAAFPVLSGAFKSANTGDYLKVAALIGMERFAACGSKEVRTPEVTKELLDLVGSNEPKAGRDKEVHNWMRRLAGQTLADIGSPGPENAVVKAFLKIIDDSRASNTMRCEFAVFLGQIKFEPGSELDFTAMAGSLGHLAADSFDRMRDGGNMSMPAQPSRAIMYPIDSALAGFGRPAAGVTPATGLLVVVKGTPHDKTVQPIYTKIKDIHGTVDKTDLAMQQMFREVRPKLQELKDSLPPVQRGGRGGPGN